MPKIVRLAKKYLDVEIKDNHWECPDCKSMIKISDVQNKTAIIKVHLKSNKHQKVINERKYAELQQKLKEKDEHIQFLKDALKRNHDDYDKLEARYHEMMEKHLGTDAYRAYDTSMF